MELFNQLISALLKNYVDIKLRPDQFSIDLEKIKLNESSYYARTNGKCPYSGRLYLVRTGLQFDPTIADRAITLASGIPNKYNYGNDLDIEPDNPIFRLAHALEHLTVSDIYLRRVFSTRGLSHGRNTYGKTIGVAFKSSTPLFQFQYPATGFYIRNGLTSPEEELTSVKNAIERVNNFV